MENLYMEDEYEDEYENEYVDEYKRVYTEGAATHEGIFRADDDGDDKEEVQGIKKLSSIINLQLLEIAEGYRKNTQLHQNIAELENRISVYEREQKELEIKNRELCNKQKELKEDLAHARELIQSLQDEERALQEKTQLEISQREECEKRLYQLEHSKSWKVTEPLRRILTLVRK